MQTVYLTGVNTTSANKDDLVSSNVPTGHIRWTDGKRYVLVQNGTSASATIADGTVCRPVVGQTTTATSVLKVVICDAITDPAVCANNTGAAVPGDHYFWGIMQGRGYALGGAAIGDGLDMMIHTTDGTVGPVAGGGATSQHLGFTISDVTTDVNNAVFWDLPSKRPIA